MRKTVHADVVAGVLLLAVASFCYFQSLDFPEDGKIFPVSVISLLALFGVLILGSGIKKSIKQNAEAVEGDEDTSYKQPILVLIILIAYVAVMNLLGFFVSTIVFMAAILFVLQVKGWKGYIFTVGGTVLFLYILFVQLLHVSLPQGVFF